MTKKVAFGGKPATPAAPAVEDWVRRAEPTPAPPPPAEATRRLTIDIPISLHTRLKVGCALKGRAIAEELRDLIEQAFPPLQP